jgi:hypothetical protein
MTMNTLSGPMSAGKSAFSATAIFPTNNHANGALDPTPSRLPPAVPGVTPDELVAVLTALTEFGDRLELGDLANVICESRNPIATLFAIADAGYIRLDLSAPCDAHMCVRRDMR